MLGHMMKALEMSYNSKNASFLRKLAIPRHPKTCWIPLDYDRFKNQYLKKNKEVEGKSDEELDEFIRKEFNHKRALMTKIKFV